MSDETINRIRKIVADVNVTGHAFRVERFIDEETKQPVNVYYVQDTYPRPDTFSEIIEYGYGRKWHVSPHATESEIVLTCLKAVLTDGEHERREGFEYKGQRIFQPHQDIGALLEACAASDAREVPPNANERMRGEIIG